MSEKITALQVALQELHSVAAIMNLSDEVTGYLETPEKLLQVRIPLRMDDGSLRFYKGYRAHHNSALGIVKGGTRLHKDETPDDVCALSFWMSIKNALAGIPAGGAKGGIAVDPATLSSTEVERLCRGYIRAIFPMIGPKIDVPGPDVGTPQQYMAWFTDEYESIAQHKDPAAFAGKPPIIGGSEGRDRSTGLGLVYTTREMLKLRSQSLAGKKIAIQGFGNLGSHAADFFAREGAKVVAITDVNGGICCDNGIDIKAAFDHMRKTGSIVNLPGTEKLSNQELLAYNCDILVPAALQNQLTADNAAAVRAKFVVEGANGPTTPAAEQMLHDSGVEVIPGILANCGGAVVAYFELVQDLHSYFWEESEVFNRLEILITRNCFAINKTAQDKKVTLRTAAWIMAVERIVKAMKVRGWVRKEFADS